MTYGEERMYKKVEVIGVSKDGIEDAVQRAIAKARQSLEGLSWFELQDIRGHINAEGKVDEYQVVIKVAFELR